MAYLRWGEGLPSGKNSGSFVVGSKGELVSFDKGSIPYEQIREWLREYDDSKIEREVAKGLGLKIEESKVVCERLFLERDSGEWDNPFEFEHS